MKSLKEKISQLAKKRIIRVISVWVGVILAILAILGIIFGPKVAKIYTQAKETTLQARKVASQLQAQNVIGLREESIILKKDIEKTKLVLEEVSFFAKLPFVSTYYNDAIHLLNAGSYSSEAAIIASDALIPFADSLGLKGSAAAGSAEEKVSKLVQIMPKIVPQVDVLQDKLKKVKKEIDPIDPKRYPEKIGSVKVRSFLGSFRSYVDGLEKVTPELKPILTNLPLSLGDPDPKTYLVLLQNDGEIRPTGGFITSVAYIKVHKGKIVGVRSEDVYKIDERIKYHPPAPPEISKTLGLDKLYLRDTNLSPDFVASMNMFNNLYQTSAGREDIDGFVALDTEFVRKLLEITGPVKTDRYGEVFSSEVGASGIPDVIYKLELYSQKLLVNTDDRKELLGDLLNSLLKAVLKSSTDKWQPLIDATYQSTQQKHLLVYSFNRDSQNLLEKYNMAGIITNSQTNDYLHINQANFGGLKSNLFITEVVEQEINVDKDGVVTKTVKLHLNNTHKSDGWLNGTYKDYVRVYAPLGSKLLEGKEVTTTTDLGKTVFATFVTLEPQSSTTLQIKYSLPKEVFSKYELTVQKQPGTKDQHFIIKLNGKSVSDTALKTDTTFSFPL